MGAVCLMTAEEVEAHPEDWRAQRRQGITASEIAGVMGIAPPRWSSPLKVWVEKVHGLAEPEDGPDTEPEDDPRARGKEMEPMVAAKYAARHPELTVLPGGLYAHDRRRWQLATLDRRLSDGRPVEIKTVHMVKDDDPANRWGDPGSNQIPDHYLAQALWQADVTGAGEVVIPAWFLLPWRLREYVAVIDDVARRDIEYMRQAAEQFIDEHVRAGRPPAVDWTPATTAALRLLHPMVVPGSQAVVPNYVRDRYQRAVNAYRRAERARDEAANVLRWHMGDAKVAVGRDGQKIASRSTVPQKRVSVARLRAERPEVAALFERETPVDKLSPAWRGER